MRYFTVNVVAMFALSCIGVSEALAGELEDAVSILSDGFKCAIPYQKDLALLETSRYSGTVNEFRVQRTWHYAKCDRSNCQGKETASALLADLRPVQLDLARNRPNGKEYKPGTRVDDLLLFQNNVILRCVGAKKCISRRQDIVGFQGDNANNGKFDRYTFEVCDGETGSAVKIAIDTLIKNASVPKQ